MRTLRCSSCGSAFQMSPEDLAGRSTAHCPACARIIVVPDTGASDADDPETNAYVEAVPAGELPTAVGAARALLSLPQGRRVSILVLSGARKGEVFQLKEPTATIGRDGGGADLEVPDAEMSRRHAAIECHGVRIVLRDLGSRNGTFVDEETVKARILEDQAEFRLGSTRFMLAVVAD